VHDQRLLTVVDGIRPGQRRRAHRTRHPGIRSRDGRGAGGGAS